MRSSIRAISLSLGVVTLGGHALYAGDCVCEGDVNGDGNVSSVDLTITVDCIGGDCAACTNDCDVDCDGDVDHVDFGVVQCEFEGRSNCCDQPAGACDGLNNVSLPLCMVTLEGACQFFEGTWHGPNTICRGDEALAVPAVSTWGFIVLALAIVSAGTILAHRRGAAGAR